MEGDRQGMGTDKEGGERLKGGTHRGETEREGGHREGGQTGRGYAQGGDTDRKRGGRRSWEGGLFVGGGGSLSSARAGGWWSRWALVARCSLRVVMVFVRSCSFMRGGPSFVGGGVVVVRASSRVVVVVGARCAPWFVVRGWWGGCSVVVRGACISSYQWKGRGGSHSPEEQRQRTTMNIIVVRRLGATSQSGRGTWCVDLPTPPLRLSSFMVVAVRRFAMGVRRPGRCHRRGMPR
jgi:hypothetical protein